MIFALIFRHLKLKPNRLTSIAIFLSILCFKMLNAQEYEEATSKAKFLGIVFNSGLASYREDLLVPLGFNGPGFTLGAGYTRISKNSDLDIRFRFGLAFLKNRFSHKAHAAILEMHIAWIKRLSYIAKYGELWFGIGLPMKMNNIFIESWDDAHLYWLTSYGLGPACRWQKKSSSKCEYSVYFEIPVISLISRPPVYRYKKQEALTHLTYHFSGPNNSLRLELPDVYKAISIKLKFTRNINHALFNLGLEFDYTYCRKPKNIYALNTMLLLSYQWKTRL